MKVLHRCNTEERQHYLLEKHYTFKLKPRLLFVTVLDKREGWREEPHSHDYLELVFVTDGQGSITVQDTTYHVHKGDLLVYNAGTQHYEISDSNDPMELRGVAFDRLEITDLPKNWLLPPEYGCCFSTGDMYNIIHTSFENLLREFENQEPLYTEIAENEARILLMQLFRLIRLTENPSSLPRKSRILELAIQYIDQHYTEVLTLDHIASACHTDKYYLSHCFTREQGMSIGKYILDKKISKAQILLTTTALTVKQIAELVGFPDSGYFCRVFKKACSVTPLKYRSLSHGS